MNYQDNHIYYNAQLKNNTNDYMEARYIDNRSAPIIMNPEDYHLAVIRFRIPSSEIPIFEFQAGAYQVTLEYNSTSFTSTVTLNEDLGPNIPTNNLVYTPDQFISSINNALLNSFNNMKSTFTTHPSTVSPYFQFDPNTVLISLYAEKNNFDNVVYPNGTKIYLNATLFNRFFTSFRPIYNGINQPYQLIIESNYQNTTTITTGVELVKTTQYCSTIGNWNDILSIIVTSTNIPTKPELVPSSAGNSQDNTLRIITDFEPPISSQTGIFSPVANQVYQYNAVIYRKIDLFGSVPLYTIDLNIYWKSINGTIYPIYLVPGEVMSMKLVFLKKGQES